MRLLIVFMMLFMLGCGGCDEKPLQKVELKEETKALDIKSMRFDEDLFNVDFSKPDSASRQLHHKYGNFFCRFVENDLLLAQCQSDSIGKLLQPFVTNRDIIETHEAIHQAFPPEKIDEINGELTDAFRRWNHFFPDSIVPAVIYYQSAWNSNISPSDSTVGISLDCYLGSDHKITRQLSPEAFPTYKKENMDEKFLVADAVKGWVAYKSRHFYKQKDLLSELIFYGKLMYISEALVPEIPDSTMLDWSAEELAWAKKHQWNTWKAIANEKIMFQTRSFEINKWFADGPFTGATDIPQDSPPQLGVWLGWNIVRQYMEANPKLAPQDLLLDYDNQKILSAFNPKR